jgi:hypothetical protein
VGDELADALLALLVVAPTSDYRRAVGRVQLPSGGVGMGGGRPNGEVRLPF